MFLLSGLTGAAVQLAEAGATATSAPSTAHCGAVAALLGVAASLATHTLRNRCELHEHRSGCVLYVMWGHCCGGLRWRWLRGV